MSGFITVQGFEDVWRPIALPKRRPPEVLGRLSPGEVRQKLARLTAYAPQVVVKVTGRIRDAGRLKAHLRYISRGGDIDLYGADGMRVCGTAEARALAEDWALLGDSDPKRRANTPLGLSMVLSMPRGIETATLLEASRNFVDQALGGQFDYVLALHRDGSHPHVHVAVRSSGRQGEHLDPCKGDLEQWRERFAQALRALGVEAEATPRRARGVTRKAERGPLRRLRDRFEAGEGPPARVVRSAYQQAAAAAFQGDETLRPWEVRVAERQRRIRTLYLQQARLLSASDQLKDRRLGAALASFVSTLPSPDSRRLELARTLRARAAARAAELDPGRSRAR